MPPGSGNSLGRVDENNKLPQLKTERALTRPSEDPLLAPTRATPRNLGRWGRSFLVPAAAIANIAFCFLMGAPEIAVGLTAFSAWGGWYYLKKQRSQAPLLQAVAHTFELKSEQSAMRGVELWGTFNGRRVRLFCPHLRSQAGYGYDYTIATEVRTQAEDSPSELKFSFNEAEGFDGKRPTLLGQALDGHDAERWISEATLSLEGGLLSYTAPLERLFPWDGDLPSDAALTLLTQAAERLEQPPLEQLKQNLQTPSVYPISFCGRLELMAYSEEEQSTLADISAELETLPAHQQPQALALMGGRVPAQVLVEAIDAYLQVHRTSERIALKSASPADLMAHVFSSLQGPLRIAAACALAEIGEPRHIADLVLPIPFPDRSQRLEQVRIDAINAIEERGPQLDPHEGALSLVQDAPEGQLSTVPKD